MKKQSRSVGLLNAALLLLGAMLGCSQMANKSAAEWTKAKRITGKEQRLSHISGLVVEDKFAYVTMGGTVADQNEGMSGLRKIALDSGAVTNLDNANNFPQAERGGIALDDKFVYWNGSGKILRVSKDGGQPQVIAAEHVGIGLDMVVDDEKVYWANHGYYSPNSPTKPSPVYAVQKQGGAVEIFADQQNIPHALLIDEQFVYWMTPTSILKRAKRDGQTQVVYQASDKEGVDEMAQDADNLYFGFRGAGESHWALRKLSKQGGAPQTLAKTMTLTQIAVDDTHVYFFDESSMTKDDLCRVAKNGGDVERLDNGYTSGSIVKSNSLVYFATLDDIYSFPK